MTGKAWLVLFLFALWCAFSTWYYNCEVKGLCGDGNSPRPTTSSILEDQNNSNTENSTTNTDGLTQGKGETEKVDENSNTKPQTTDMGETSDMAIRTASFSMNSAEISAETVESLLSNELFENISAGEKILITGKYYESENNSSGLENLGFARAQTFMNSLVEKIDAENIELSSELIEGEANEEAMNDLLSFSKIIPEEEKELAQRDGKVIVYFDFISDEPKLGDEVKEYLNGVAQDLVEDRNKYIVATGYSDSRGNTKNNYYMGQHRAEALKIYLVEQGARTYQVHVRSFGEYRPVADNNTEEGRAKNRRVEIKLND